MKNNLAVTNEYGFSNSEKRGGEMDLNVLGNTWMQMYAKKAHQKISTPYETNLRNGLVL